MRIRATAVVIRDDRVLLVDRRKDGRSYSTLPGGAVEQGETLEEACLRELREETGLDGVVTRLLPVPLDIEAPAFYLAVAVGSSKLYLGEPEASRSSPSNVYEPRWVALADLDARDLAPGARTAIRAATAQSR